MGSVSSVPLEDLSSEDVAEAVAGLGSKYEPYGQEIMENGVNGKLLLSFDDEDLVETFDELGIKSKLHRKALKQALDTAKKVSSSANVPNIGRSSTFGFSESHQEVQTQGDEEKEELQAYRSISEKMLAAAGPNNVFAGVNLLTEETQYSLSASFRLKNGEMMTINGHELPRSGSLCKHLMSSPEDQKTFEVDPEYPMYAPNGDEYSGQHQYCGHVLKQNGKRVGTVCVVSALSADDEKEQERVQLLEEFAAITESQLKDNKALWYRYNKLKSQLDDRKLAAKRTGPGDDKQEGTTSNGTGTSGKSLFNLATRPVDQNINPASQEEMGHLPPNFFHQLDEFNWPHPPIGNDDLERVAAVELLGFRHIEKDDPLVKSLNVLVSMAGRLLGYDLAQISMHNHVKEFVMCRYTAEDLEKEHYSCFSGFYKTTRGSCNGLTLYQKDRNSSLCNYPIYKKETFMVNDSSVQEDYLHLKDIFLSYLGTPIFNVDGRVVAVLCMFGFRKPMYPSERDVAQLELTAYSIAQLLENWAVKKEMEKMERERSLIETSDQSLKTLPPDGEATIILTDVQGSTALWEADPSAMQDALVLHDDIMRKCYKENHGYEITTEGDAFHLAFHDPIDAVQFALSAQQRLQEAEWSDAILRLPDAADDGKLSRGLRVRMAIHTGPVTAKENEVTGRMEYSGETWNIASSVEAMTYGGQVLATADAWRVASRMTESLGSPQVVDLGEHVLCTGTKVHEGVISKRVVQLIPKELAFDYFSQRRQDVEKRLSGIGDSTMKGRIFAPPKTKRQLRASFYDAPYANGEVTILFIYTSEVKHHVENPDIVLASLTRLFSSVLEEFDGYECKTGMFVFSQPTAAVEFGLKILSEVEKRSAEGPTNLAKLLKVGAHTGTFTSMGPNPTTGRADYYGQVVNRAARVAGAAGMGEIYFGTASEGQDSQILPQIESGIDSIFVGSRMLKGVKQKMSLFSCRRATIS